jgi:hypothetical protein
MTYRGAVVHRRATPAHLPVVLVGLALAGCGVMPAAPPMIPSEPTEPATENRSQTSPDASGVEVSPAPRPTRIESRRLPSTGSSAVPPVQVGRLVPAPAPGPFAINLYRRRDFVSQANERYCVPAAIQTMVNVMEPGASRSTAAQHRYYRLARRYSTDRLVGPGAEPEGWARTLEVLGYGDYGVTSHRTRARAVHAAARALRLTGRPVGLLMWRGAHAWVMTGFRATADPAYAVRFQVTHVYVSDVWYPRVSSIWGPSRPPDARVPVEALPADYLRWRRPTARYPEKDGQFVVVVPVLAPGAAAG